MASIYNANWVVLYNSGEYVWTQQKFFGQERDARAWAKAFARRHPVGSGVHCSVHRYDPHTQKFQTQDYDGAEIWVGI